MAVATRYSFWEFSGKEKKYFNKKITPHLLTHLYKVSLDEIWGKAFFQRAKFSEDRVKSKHRGTWKNAYPHISSRDTL